MHDVQHVSQRAHGLRHGRDSADLPGLSSLKRSSPGSVSSISAGTVSYGDGGPADIEEDYVHLQLCNSCAEVCLLAYSRAVALNLAPPSPSSASGTSASIAPPNLIHTTWYVMDFKTLFTTPFLTVGGVVLGLRVKVVQSPRPDAHVPQNPPASGHSRSSGV